MRSAIAWKFAEKGRARSFVCAATRRTPTRSRSTRAGPRSCGTIRRVRLPSDTARSRSPSRHRETAKACSLALPRWSAGRRLCRSARSKSGPSSTSPRAPRPTPRRRSLGSMRRRTVASSRPGCTPRSFRSRSTRPRSSRGIGSVSTCPKSRLPTSAIRTGRLAW